MSKKHPSRNTNQKGDKVQDDGTLWLHSLLCSETHRHHKRSYMTSLHPVKVKALRDTGDPGRGRMHSNFTVLSVHSTAGDSSVLVQVPFSLWPSQGRTNVD